MNNDFIADSKSFVLYKDWEDILNCFEFDSDVGLLFRAVFAYVRRGDLPDFSGALKVAFTVMANQIDRDGIKWEHIRKLRSEAGKKGGRPKKESLEQEKAKKANAFFDKQKKQTKAKKAVNVPVPVNVPIIESENEKRSFSPSPPQEKSKCYGEYMHVLLDDDQLTKLVKDFGNNKTTEYIQRVDEYCQQSGKLYKDYYLTIRKWIKSDEDKARRNEQGQNASFNIEDIENMMNEANKRKDPAAGSREDF